jgi:hypothetical protein
MNRARQSVSPASASGLWASTLDRQAGVAMPAIAHALQDLRANRRFEVTVGKFAASRPWVHLLGDWRPTVCQSEPDRLAPDDQTTIKGFGLSPRNQQHQYLR